MGEVGSENVLARLDGHLRPCGEAHISAYFNKGIVAAQWVSRDLAAQPQDSKIKDLVAQRDNPVRNALSVLLRPQILSLLADTQKNRARSSPLSTNPMIPN
jgi:hypothetical protein